MITMKETRNGVTEVSEITQAQYNNITSDDTLKWFRRLGELKRLHVTIRNVATM